ncbi:MAG: FAD-dependent monooxygenase [Firmicutes bacterium]|nr:FAD-dependent monooxygenase [Bacillota bacterium]
MVVDVVIIGARPAGLSLSYFLQRRGIGHVVLEQGQIGDSLYIYE